MSDQRFRMALSDENRVGRHWDARGQSVQLYAVPGRATLLALSAAYTDPAQVRELADWLLTAADRMESK